MSDDNQSDERAEQRSSMWAGELDDMDEQDTNDDSSTKDNSGTNNEKVSKDALGNKSNLNALNTENTKDTLDNSDAEREWDVQSIRDEWNPNSIRLPDSVQESFDSEHKRLDWQLEDIDLNFEYGKDRHYKPLIIALGVQCVQEMDAEEIAENLEEMVDGDLLDDS